MTSRTTRSSSAERLRASPSFALAFTLDGRPYVAKETEPYIQYWLTERYRILLSMFSGRSGASAAEAIDGYFRLTRAKRGDAERKRLVKAIEDMRTGGVLIGSRDDTSRYDARMAADYLTHRPFPRELSELIIRSAPIGESSRVLDLAGGPGSLAVALAQASGDVSLMELSRGFVNAARARAKRLGVRLTTLHESCNRLMFLDEHYDVVTVSQALHWLDDVLVCRGICRVLQPGGSFFVIHSSMDLEDRHPLSPVFGNKSILGHKDPRPFAAQVQALARRLSLLFDALDAPEVHRHDPAQRRDTSRGSRIVPAGAWLFRQQRSFDIGYARAFLTPQHIESAGHDPAAVWKELEARCAGASAQDIRGAFDWAVLQFRRGGAPAPLQFDAREVAQISWDAPVAA
jgi:ubiquinone/menaquinone biosynthesis C-methylase UbiE